jgi:cytoskeleton protein RodZ
MSDTSIGAQLASAREALGLSAHDIADRLKVRPSIVSALENDRFNDLPEPIYTRAYLQRYAQIVGLDAQSLVRSYDQRAGYNSLQPVSVPKISVPRARRGVPLVAVLAGVLLAGAAGAGAWMWWQARANPAANARTPLENAARQVLRDNTRGSNTLIAPSQGDPANLLTVKLSVTSTPSGAAVLLDRFKIGVTPLKDAPVSGGRQRELRLERPGYKAFTQKIELTQNRNLSITLSPVPVAPPPAVAAAAPTTNQIVLRFRGRSWLRVTNASGTVLYEGIPEAGSSQNFAGPITVRAGRPDVIAATSSAGTRDPLGGASAGTFRLP